MGVRDSSKTRVAPIFDWLADSDPAGLSWIDRLLALGSRREAIESLPKGQALAGAHGRRWGTDEMGVPAPQLLLEHLVLHVDPKRLGDSADAGTALAKRRALAGGDEPTIAEALRQLRAGKRGRQWFVLEGESRPDALLETEQLVVCIEGKRTEKKCTIETTWMRRRSQLVRHMDSATEHFRDKRVVGLLIVEGDGGAEAVEPSVFWHEQCAAQYEASMLEDSMPHREQKQLIEIGANILGVTTWQAVCAEFGIPWPPAPDLI